MSKASGELHVSYWVPTRYQVTLSAAEVAETFRRAGFQGSAEIAEKIARGETVTGQDGEMAEELSEVGNLADAIQRHSELFALAADGADPEEVDAPEDFHVTIGLEGN